MKKSLLSLLAVILLITALLSFTNRPITMAASVPESDIAPLAAVSCGTPGFVMAAGSPLTAGTVPATSAIADFNADGKLDLAVANFSSANVSVLLGMGNGMFGAATNFSVASNPQSVAVADFNGDGKLDLVVANAGSSNVSVLLGMGNGMFGTATNFGAGSQPVSVAVADFNADGKTDIAVANLASNNISILLGAGNGSFGGATNFNVGSNPQEVKIGDFNADGKLDLAVANNGSNNVSILLGMGNGSFGAATNFNVGSIPLSLVVADFNADGKLDIVTANRLSNNLSILLGMGNGSFGTATNFGVGQGFRSVDTTDFNGDGKLDLVVANNSTTTVSIFFGMGNGSFGAATNVTVGTNPLGVTAGDLNGDGKPDFVTANNSSTVTVILNNLTSTCAQLGFAAGSPVTVGNNVTAPAVADFNLDGKLDFAVANANDNTVSIRLGNGTGGFTASPDVTVGTTPLYIVTADFNRDGKPDLAVVNTSSGTVQVLIGDGTGGFVAGTAIPVGGTSPNGLVAADLNNDGKIDLATNNFNSNNVTVLIGNGLGGFTALPVIPAGNSPLSILAADFNQDGKLDLVVTNSTNSGTITPLIGDGLGGFTTSTPVTVGPFPLGITSGDFNRDGKIDLATSSQTSNNIAVLLGNGAGGFTVTSVPAGGLSLSLANGDFNRDGKLDILVGGSGSDRVLLGDGSGNFAIGTSLTTTQNSNVAAGDFNNDGKLDYLSANKNNTNVNVLLNTCLSAANSLTTTAGSAQSAIINTAFATALQATVFDPAGQPIPNSPVFFDAPTTGASGTFTGGLDRVMVTSNVNGIATAPTFTANGTGGTYMVTASASNGSINVCTTFMLTNIACNTITLSPASLPNGTIGVAYNQTISASGGTTPYTFAVTAGTLPTGLTLSSAGNLSGTPTATGSFTFTVTATDGSGNNCTGMKSYSITVTCPTITLSPTSLPGVTVGVAYSQTITAIGGASPYSFSLMSGTLPSGITLSTAGMISGTTTQTGSFPITVKATDANGCSGTQSYTLTVSCPSITLSPVSLPNTTTGLSYNQTITASGGASPYSFTLSAGSLPTGLSLSTDGTISGTATAAGSFTFTVKATDANGCFGTQQYTIIVSCPTITLSPSSLPGATTGIAYSQTLTASGSTSGYSFSVSAGTLPNGLTLSTTGQLSGTLTTAGTFNFTVTATDANSCTGSQAYSITIVACSTVTFSPTSLPNAVVLKFYSQTITASGNASPYSFKKVSGSLPPGMSLSSTGVLSGQPNSVGTYNFTIMVNSAAGCTGSQSYSLQVVMPITISPGSLSDGSVNQDYFAIITASGGTAPYTFRISAGALPPGFTLAVIDSSRAIIRGQTGQAGTYNFTVTATDVKGSSGSQNYLLVIR